MKITIINCFDTYNERVSLVKDYFERKNNTVNVIHSNFSHSKKEYFLIDDQNYIPVKAKAYNKNLSFSRLYSHYNFSRKALKIAEKIRPDILYVILPANSLAKFSGMYKKKYPETFLVFDIMDLWPETFPFKKFKRLPIFKAWQNIRDNSLSIADFIITECDLFLGKIEKKTKANKSITNYLAKKEISTVSTETPDKSSINLAYLGSINNIIDIELIVEIIKKLTLFYPVNLHIVGDGEKKDELVLEAENANATVYFHGKVYDSQKKQEIFDLCHFGLNIMKETVFVGLTMKSIDYAQFGLPLINNIPADTEKIVKTTNSGVNITKDINTEEIINYFNYINDNPNIKEKIKNDVFIEYFSIEKFNNKMDTVFKSRL